MRETVVAAVIAALATAFAAWLWFLLWKIRYTRMVRDDAVARSQAVTAGKVYEQFVPYLPGFEFNPADARFLGSPVDLVVFDGLSEGAVRRIVFVEAKSGGAQLTARERSVRDAIRDGQVEWVELRAGRALIP